VNLLRALLIVLAGAAAGCTTNDREYIREHIVQTPASAVTVASAPSTSAGLQQEIGLHP